MARKELPTDYELLKIAKQFQREHDCTIGTAFIRGACYIKSIIENNEKDEEGNI